MKMRSKVCEILRCDSSRKKTLIVFQFEAGSVKHDHWKQMYRLSFVFLLNFGSLYVTKIGFTCTLSSYVARILNELGHYYSLLKPKI